MKRTDNYTVVSFRVEEELAEQLKAEESAGICRHQLI